GEPTWRGFIMSSLVPRDLVAAHGAAFGAALLLDDPHVARTAHLERAPVPSDNGETVGNAERLGVERGELARRGACRLVLAAARVVVRAVDGVCLREEGMRLAGFQKTAVHCPEILGGRCFAQL